MDVYFGDLKPPHPHDGPFPSPIRSRIPQAQATAKNRHRDDALPATMGCCGAGKYRLTHAFYWYNGNHRKDILNVILRKSCRLVRPHRPLMK